MILEDNQLKHSIIKKTVLILTITLLNNLSYGQNWALIKEAVSPINEMPLEYDSIFRQPLSTLGWEDGIHISKDGLNLYCTYVPIDFLSFVLNGDLPNNFSDLYLRGAPTFEIDLITNPIGEPEWLHSEILYAHRNTISDSFNLWTLSDMSRNFYSEGAPAPTFLGETDLIEFMMFTSNNSTNNNTDIWIINNTFNNPSGVGAPMPFPVNTLSNEDNPHLVRLDSNNLILFFDSNNLPNGLGDIDIWFSESNNNGTTWSTPINVNTINTTGKEHQPFLHKDLNINKWFLYYSALHTDGKLAIYRVEQMIINNWNSWGNLELVISAGNSAGIGEPTLTENGDISFVVIYADPNMNSIYNHFDSDPWFLQKKNLTAGISENYKNVTSSIYPNPATEFIIIDFEKKILNIKIYNSIGELMIITSEKFVKINHLSKGIYHLSIQFESKEMEMRKLIKY